VDGHHLVPCSDHDAAPRDPFLGTTVGGQFPILGIVGFGGMGIVYRSVQPMVEREVAVKILQPAPAKIREVVQQRFLREAKVIARLSHPAIVTLHHFGLEPDGTAFMVMEYVRGRTLTSLIREGPVRPTLVVDVALEVLEALEVAHEQGLVHRDLKPDNVMLLDEPIGSYHVKVLDFGLAKLLTGETGERITRTGAVFGTPQYMAPEQATGGDADARTDLYSLGVLLFEALAGYLPFDAEQPYELLSKHIATPVPDLPSGLADALQACVRRALQKEPADRFQSAGEMAQALRDVRDATDPEVTLQDAAATVTTVPKLATRAVDAERAPPLTPSEPASLIDPDRTAEDASSPSLGDASGEVGWSLESMEVAGLPGRQWRRKVLLACLLMALGVAAIIFLATRERPAVAIDPPPPPPPVAATKEPASKVADRPPSRPPRVTTVHLDSVPLGAEVFHDTELVGRTPLTLTPSGPDGWRLRYRLVAEARVPATVEVVLDGKEHNRLVRLESTHGGGRSREREETVPGGAAP